MDRVDGMLEVFARQRNGALDDCVKMGGEIAELQGMLAARDEKIAELEKQLTALQAKAGQ